MAGGVLEGRGDKNTRREVELKRREGETRKRGASSCSSITRINNACLAVFKLSKQLLIRIKRTLFLYPLLCANPWINYLNLQNMFPKNN